MLKIYICQRHCNVAKINCVTVNSVMNMSARFLLRLLLKQYLSFCLKDKSTFLSCHDHPEARVNRMLVTLETNGGVLSTLNPSEDTLVIAPAPL